MLNDPVTYQDLVRMLGVQGLSPRGGFHPGPDDPVPRAGAKGDPRTLLLVGVVGRRMWPAFERNRGAGANPLDAWTKRVLDPIACRLDGIPVYPNDRPFWPFQQWAKRCEPLFESPLGLLIHPEFGLWHAYRAAILLPQWIDLPAPAASRSPCETCAERPCLSACPVAAFTDPGYDVPKCASHLKSEAGRTCLSGGCQARDACPVGEEYRYASSQIRFHMAAFERSLNPR